MKYSFLIKPIVYISSLVFSLMIIHKSDKEEKCNCEDEKRKKIIELIDNKQNNNEEKIKAIKSLLDQN